jgi:two-component system chemotaxis sensor kinase CheA
LDAVRRAAESRGARGLGRAELLRMLFTPGFTTRTQAGALSGRGVGLDAVDARVSRLGGLVELATEEGAGTSITLTLPATLAVQAALLVSSAGRVFALPVGQVVEVVNASERDPALKSQRLDRLLGIANGNGAGTPEPRYAIVCGPPSARAALLVDTLEGEEELVVQPLGGALRDVRGVAGAAELAGHRAAIVLDAGALAAEVAA